MTGNINVLGFFLLGAGVFGFLSMRFAAAKKAPFQHFGFGLAAFSVAFLIWGVTAGMHPDTASLGMYLSLGVVPFVAGFLLLVSAATYDWQKNTRTTALLFAVAFLLALFAVRSFLLPSEPGYSEAGLMYFNAAPLVELMYVLAFAGGFMTSLHVVTREIKHRLTAALTRIFFNVVTICGVVLLVSHDDELQQLNGLLMLAAFVGLAVVYSSGDIKNRLK